MFDIFSSTSISAVIFSDCLLVLFLNLSEPACVLSCSWLSIYCDISGVYNFLSHMSHMDFIESKIEVSDSGT